MEGDAHEEPKRPSIRRIANGKNHTWKTAFKTAAEKIERYPQLLTLEQIQERTGLGICKLRENCRNGNLRATKHTWNYGIIRRSAWIVHVKDLQDFLTRLVIEETLA